MNINPNTVQLHEARYLIIEYINSTQQRIYTSANFRTYINQRTGKLISTYQLSTALSQLVSIGKIRRIGTGIFSKTDD